jgi:release factor glutamine methyltransferase
MSNETKEIRKLKQAKDVQGENEMLKSETLNLFQGMVQHDRHGKPESLFIPNLFRDLGLQMTVLEILNWSTNCLKDHQIENPRLNAELLLSHSLSLNREELYIRLHSHIREEEKATLERLIKRRISGEPLQYILGHQEFWSIDFKVDPRVLIPRPETELLVEQSLSILSETPLKRPPFVLEIGTGSGAVAISLAKEVRDIFLVATDISREALMLANENAKFSGILHQIQFVHGNLFDPFRLLREREPFDLILSNPPYITCSEIEGLAREVRDYEPIIALNGGKDGLTFYRNIILQAPFYLKKGGWLLLEVGQTQGEKVSELIQKRGDFLTPQRLQDLSGIERVVKAQRKENPNAKI